MTDIPCQTNTEKAIILATSGTTYTSAANVFDQIKEQVQKAYCDIPVIVCFTSRIIRRRLAAKGQKVLSFPEALAYLKAKEYKEVIAQSLHVIPGGEFHDMMTQANSFNSMGQGFTVKVGMPLCSTMHDLKKVAQALCSNLPQEREKNQAVIFMGHGTKHPANTAYPALAYMLSKNDPLIFLGTLDSYPDLGLIIKDLLERKINQAYLLPFLTVAGAHAQRDMAGESPDSWRSLLEKNGIKCKAILRTISENSEIVKIWLQHLESAWQELAKAK